MLVRKRQRYATCFGVYNDKYLSLSDLCLHPHSTVYTRIHLTHSYFPGLCLFRRPVTVLFIKSVWAQSGRKSDQHNFPTYFPKFTGRKAERQRIRTWFYSAALNPSRRFQVSYVMITNTNSGKSINGR